MKETALRNSFFRILQFSEINSHLFAILFMAKSVRIFVKREMTSKDIRT